MVLFNVRKWASWHDGFLVVSFTKWEVEYKPIYGQNRINTLS